MSEEKLRKIINLYREKVNISGDDLKIIETRNKYLKKVHFHSVLFFYLKKQFFKNIFVCSESISNFRC